MNELDIVPTHQELGERINWLIQLRWWAIVFVLFVIAIANAVLPGILPLPYLLIIVVIMALYNLAIQLHVRRFKNLDFPARHRREARIAYVQIALDMFFITLLLHFSGGLENPFFFYYVLHIIIVNILFSKKTSLLFSGLASLLFCGMLVLEAWHIVPHYNLREYRAASRYAEPVHVISVGFTLTSTLLSTTFLASSIMARLRVRTSKLIETNRSCQMRARDLAKLNTKLTEMDDARTQFTLLVAHELRAPVAAIHSYLKLILEGYVPPDKEREILERSEHRAMEQLDLIADLLELGRIRRKAAEKKADWVHVEQVLDSVCSMLQGNAQRKEIELSVEVIGKLSPVRALLDHIKQVWTNLISNAVKYTEPGGTVKVTVTQDETHIIGSVQDTGIGIPPEHQEHIFEDFFRTEEAKSMERRGTGLGLSIVKRVVQVYGGQIEVESTVGEGSTFTFRLPRDVDAPDADE